MGVLIWVLRIPGISRTYRTKSSSASMLAATLWSSVVPVHAVTESGSAPAFTKDAIVVRLLGPIIAAEPRATPPAVEALPLLSDPGKRENQASMLSARPNVDIQMTGSKPLAVAAHGSKFPVSSNASMIGHVPKMLAA